MKKPNKSAEASNNAKIENIQNLLNLDLTQQLRIKVLDFINTAIRLNRQCPSAAETYISMFYDMFMTLSKVLKDIEAISVDAVNKAPEAHKLPVFTEISHDRSIAEWDFFLSNMEEGEEAATKRKRKNMFKNL